MSALGSVDIGWSSRHRYDVKNGAEVRPRSRLRTRLCMNCSMKTAHFECFLTSIETRCGEPTLEIRNTVVLTGFTKQSGGGSTPIITDCGVAIGSVVGK